MSKMRDAGMAVEHFEKYFDPKTADHVWLESIARRGWIVVSKDREIMRSELSVRTTIDSGAHLFICIGGKSHEEIAENIIRAQHKMALWSHRHRNAGFVARLYMSKEPQGERRRKAPGEIKAFDHERFLSRHT